MDQVRDFPFYIGQRVEAKSNVKGYRGAWFHCEIRDIQLRKDEICCALQYLDFPDEKVSFTKAYQKDLADKKRKTLMVRPSFPSVFQKADQPAAADEGTGVIVVLDEWRVGNTVDWWSDGCYWMAAIMEILDKDLMQIELLKPPVGEGGVYKADVKDLRPSLCWSISHQWTIPFEKAESNCESFSLLGKQLQPHLEDAICSNQNKGEGSTELSKYPRLHEVEARKQTTKVISRGENFSMSLDEKAKLRRKSSRLKSEQLFGAGEMHNLGIHDELWKAGVGGNIIKHDSSTVSTHPGDTRNIVNNIGNLSNEAASTRGIHLWKSERGNIQQTPKVGFGNLGFSSICLEEEFPQQQHVDRNTCSFEAQELKEVESVKGVTEQQIYVEVTTYQEHEQFKNQLSDKETSIQQVNFSPAHEVAWGVSCDMHENNDAVVLGQDIGSLIQEGKCVNLDEGNIGSSVVALEELVSRVVWLKGVLQLGLKGWSNQRSKRKWTLCEAECDHVILHQNAT